jgi:hypothetical protein
LPTPTIASPSEVRVRRDSIADLAVRSFFVGILAVVPLAPAAFAQGTPAPTQQASTVLSKEQIAAFAKLQVEVSKAQDSAQAQLAQPRNKTAQMQEQLREKLRTQVAEILHHANMTDVEFRRRTFLVSTDPDTRKSFDAEIVRITGAPLPGQVPVVVAPAPAYATLPAGAVGTHIGHVVNSFGDTPGGLGLLPMAVAEAKTAAQHAALGARTPENLDAMKLHAGHVVHALDPSIVNTGPGKGYGAKRAALAAASHIDLAAKAPGASQNVITHSMHIATASKAAAARAEQVIALARQIQMATTAAEAAKLYGQLVPLAAQVYEGFDANSDGRIGWQEGEGGLAQAEQHVMLMMNAEKP